VYLQADDAPALAAALTAVGGQLCCGCEKTCDPPELLFALDRTLTMHKTVDGGTPVDAPNYASSKWAQAIAAIEGVAGSGLDGDLRLGLELWPRDPGGGQCLTLAERITNSKQATNPQCEAGEILVPPALDNGAAITAAIDPLTTNICISTPTGAGLLTASDWLIDHVVPGRKQYVVLVTDGADWDFSCPGSEAWAGRGSRRTAADSGSLRRGSLYQESASSLPGVTGSPREIEVTRDTEVAGEMSESSNPGAW
jgi:hypothetical protein